MIVTGDVRWFDVLYSVVLPWCRGLRKHRKTRVVTDRDVHKTMDAATVTANANKDVHAYAHPRTRTHVRARTYTHTRTHTHARTHTIQLDEYSGVFQAHASTAGGRHPHYCRSRAIYTESALSALLQLFSEKSSRKVGICVSVAVICIAARSASV